MGELRSSTTGLDGGGLFPPPREASLPPEGVRAGGAVTSGSLVAPRGTLLCVSCVLWYQVQ